MHSRRGLELLELVTARADAAQTLGDTAAVLKEKVARARVRRGHAVDVSPAVTPPTKRKDLVSQGSQQ